MFSSGLRNESSNLCRYSTGIKRLVKRKKHSLAKYFFLSVNCVSGPGMSEGNLLNRCSFPTHCPSGPSFPPSDGRVTIPCVHFWIPHLPGLMEGFRKASRSPGNPRSFNNRDHAWRLFFRTGSWKNIRNRTTERNAPPKEPARPWSS
ncbi:MAG: hypothetical protein UZ16_OP3001001343 [Candidatus Hinthialibacteria bacterium OLB16]|nr:MAG: hypothetical protein UZ16_OP3001001343 [Candidatus Hinthialibacteria bacterium OLB16]